MLMCCLMWTETSVAQDIHFTQPDVNPLLLNPAYSGFFEGTGRFGLAYRNQWASVTNPFQTIAVTAEYSLLHRRYQRDGLSLGAILYADREGELNYGNMAANAILSYYKALNDAIIVSIGMQGGWGQSGFDIANARFLDSRDVVADQNVNYPLIGAGMAWYCQPREGVYIKVGAAAHNLNRPNISYLALKDTYLERHYNIYARAEYRYWDNVSLLPMLALQWQRNYSEYLFGMDAKWFLSEDSRNLLAMSAGLYYRWRDALNVVLSLDYNTFTLAFCYDANISKLTAASRSIGAFELQIIYKLDRGTHLKHKALPCPII